MLRQPPEGWCATVLLRGFSIQQRHTVSCAAYIFEDFISSALLQSKLLARSRSMPICCNGGTAEDPCPCQLTQAKLDTAKVDILTYICTTPGCGHSYGRHIPGVALAPGNTHLRRHSILRMIFILRAFTFCVVVIVLHSKIHPLCIACLL